MLKKRIKKWDLDRNHKQADMLHALALAWNRRKEGKETNFLIRGRLVTFPEVQNYFRRKGIRDLESLAGHTLDAKPTTRIECCTPRTSTADYDYAQMDSFSGCKNDFNRQYPSSYFGDYRSKDIIILPEQPQLIDTTSLTAPLNHLNSMLHLNRNYFDAMVEHPDWRTKSEIFDMKILEQFYHHMIDGQSLVKDHCMVEGFKCFNKAFDLVRDLLRNRTVLFMPYIYHFVATGRCIEFQDVKGILLDFVTSMASYIGISLFPIRYSSSLLKRLSKDERVEYSKRVLGCILHLLKQSFEGNEPTEDEICSDMICDYWQKDNNVEYSLNSTKLAAIAVWKLHKDIGDIFNLGKRLIYWEKHSSKVKLPLVAAKGSWIIDGRPKGDKAVAAMFGWSFDRRHNYSDQSNASAICYDQVTWDQGTLGSEGSHP
jgi:hypothetical protein